MKARLSSIMMHSVRPVLFNLRGGKPLAAALFLGAVSSAFAVDGTWVTGSGNGDWSDATKWSGSNVAGGTDATATFDGATGRDITLTAPVTIGNINVTNWSSTAWRIIGDTLTLDVSSGVPTITAPAGDSLAIYSVIAGNEGFKLAGVSRVYLAGVNTFTGGVEVSSGVLYTKNAAALNSNTVTLSGAATQWLIDGGGSDYASDVVVGSSSTYLNMSQNGSTITLSGDISESGGTRDLVIRTNGGDAGVVLSGNNSYTGNTLLGATHNFGYVAARATTNNALGTGTANVDFASGGSKTHDDDALELANNITIANKTLTLRGQGRSDAGSLRSVSGTNTWSGGVNTGTFGNARIGVDADQLTISGVISGAGAGGLTKVGDGMVVLSNGNSYTNGTLVNAGTLLVGHEDAVAGGDLTLGDGAGTDTLSISGDVALNVDDLSLTTSAKLAFNLTGNLNDTMISVFGDQIGSGTYIVDIFDGGGFANGTYTLMTVAGSFAAADFVLGNLPGDFAGSSLSWNSGTLVLNAVPEPTTGILVGLGLIGFLSARRSRASTRD